MKKLLTLLSVAILGSTVVTPNILFNTTSEYIDREVNLNVRYFEGIKEGYCLPSCLQSILDYFKMDLNDFDQDTLFDELAGVPTEVNIGQYLNNVIPEGKFDRDYADNLIPVGFGQWMGEMALFQYYVLNSLFKGHPVLMRYSQVNPGGEPFGHAILITGIRTNADPQLTVYTAIDPMLINEPSPIITFNGTTLYDYYFNLYPTVITGYQSNSDFQRDDLVIAIDDWDVDRNDLSDYENEEVVRLQRDLTAEAGINTTGELQNQFKEISLDDSTTQIELLTNTIEIEGFSIPLVKIPTNEDTWISEIMTIHEQKQNEGPYFREGKVSAQLAFHRTTQVQHLIVTIIIYMAAMYGPISGNGHVAMNTGTTLSFVRNK